jgi:hypothetical protein
VSSSRHSGLKATSWLKLLDDRMEGSIRIVIYADDERLEINHSVVPSAQSATQLRISWRNQTFCGSASFLRCQKTETAKVRISIGGSAETRPKPGAKALATRPGKVISASEAATAARPGDRGRPAAPGACPLASCRRSHAFPPQARREHGRPRNTVRLRCPGPAAERPVAPRQESLLRIGAS